MDKLERWPILQFGAIALIIIVTVMTYARVLSSKFPSSTSSPQLPNTTSEVSFLYFQGWFKSVLDAIGELKTNQEVNRLQLREVFGEEFRKTRHDLKSSLASTQAEIMSEIEKNQRELNARIDELQNKRNR